jgi:hypothetical protein
MALWWTWLVSAAYAQLRLARNLAASLRLPWQRPAPGAIWRCKRVVVVGDPKQIEPVVTLPFTAQQALRLNADIAEWWLPGSTST